MTNLVGCASETADPQSSTTADEALSSDVCRTPALNAAEVEYGNDPNHTRTKVIAKGKKYEVTVGIGNPEDGAHTYMVVFAGDCRKS